MQRIRAISAAWAWFVLITVMLGGTASGEEAAKPKATSAGRPLSPAEEPALVEKALQAMGGAEEIVFAVRDLCSAGQCYATFGVYSNEQEFVHAPDGARLCKLNLRTRQVTALLDDPKGGVRDPRVHYDGGKILFSYRKGSTHHYHLCEINTDGSGFRQLTFGDWDDVDPAYLPDGGIVFASSRASRFVPCNRVQVAILYRMDADGGNMLCLSASTLLDDRPAVLPDGRVLYTRWEYLDRAAEKFRDLWVMNPDGTGQMVLFGGMGRPYPDFFAKCDALPIPGTNKVVSVFSPALGQRENAGNVMVVDLTAGPDDWSAAKRISPKVPNLVWSIGLGHGREGFRDPYPLSEDCFLAASDKSLLILGGNGETQEVYRAAEMVHDPRVICPRPREPVIPPRSDLEKTTGQLVLTNVYHGRNMKGVKPGDIKSLLVLEDLPKPASVHGLPGAFSMGGTFTLRRILGSVPVEPDGSASFEVPALRAIYFVALDEKGLAVKRMQSFTMVMPGETRGCVGCHEPRTGTTGRLVGSSALMALERPPSLIEPIAGVPEVIDYPRDVQPVWDRHCVSCHSAENPLGHVVLTGDYNEWFTQSYYALFAYDQISDVRNWGEDGNNPPWGFGTGASPLMKMIDGSHYDAKLTEQEYDLVRLWVESSAVFTGTYAVYNRRENAVAEALDTSKVTLGSPVGPIVERRCLTCHGSVALLGQRVTKEEEVGGDGRSKDGKPPEMLNLPRHCWNLYNLSYPEKSMILLAPLAKEAGGYGWCEAEDGQPVAVFRDAEDPDYQTILQAVRAAKTRQEKAGRYGMPGYRPEEHYVRWLKRFGILPESFDVAKDPIDPYETDKAYWRSLWYHPPAAGTASVAGQASGGK
ncbi:MAG: hypothetical protein ABIP48_02260 [Planctomycetota bacterium]